MMKEETDETAWEVGHFLQLGVQCHPLVLETFVAPVETVDEWGEELRTLFPAVWSAQTAYDAFLQYAGNQRRKMLDKKDSRPEKYAASYLRVLYYLCELLGKGTFSLDITGSPIGETLHRIKEGDYRTGEVIDLGEHWTEAATARLGSCSHVGRAAAVEAFLVRLRKYFLN
jgi:hypothetical protein